MSASKMNYIPDDSIHWSALLQVSHLQMRGDCFPTVRLNHQFRKVKEFSHKLKVKIVPK